MTKLLVYHLPKQFYQICMYAPILSEATKTLGNWGFYSPQFVIECVFLTLLIIIQSNVVISMNVFDCNDSYHGFTFLVLHTILFIPLEKTSPGKKEGNKRICHGACLVLWKLKRFAIIELDAGNVNLDGF